MVYIAGGVFSQAEGFTDLALLTGAFAFHAISMALGTFMVGKAAGRRVAGSKMVAQQ
ncbi:MAG: hypothetical protein ACYC1C_15505 [Chloroflexota bacterium]